jgi:hypothetical protein
MNLEWLDLDHAQDWIRSRQMGAAPPMHGIAHPLEIAKAVEQSLRRLIEMDARVSHLPSGLVMLSAKIDNNLTEVESAANELARSLDPERVWVDLADQSGYLQHDFHTALNGVKVIGPGGRFGKGIIGTSVTYDVSIHPRRHLHSGGKWRSAKQIAFRLADIARERGSIDSCSFGGAYGYYEPSAFEVASMVRPAFIFVLESTAVHEGPRWRLVVVEAATESEECPPWLGLERSHGACY